MLYRIVVALEGYNRARGAGLKHSSAVKEAVMAVRSSLPDMPISESEVRRILATYQPQRSSTAFTVTRIADSEIQRTAAMFPGMGLPDAAKIRSGLAFGFGPRPRYPRHNGRPQKTPTSHAKARQP